jgi:hypothetical protein
MEDVERRAIIARIMTLDFMVINKAQLIPSRETFNGPREKIVSPGEVKGSISHKRRTKPLTISKR